MVDGKAVARRMLLLLSSLLLVVLEREVRLRLKTVLEVLGDSLEDANTSSTSMAETPPLRGMRECARLPCQGLMKLMMKKVWAEFFV